MHLALQQNQEITKGSFNNYNESQNILRQSLFCKGFPLPYWINADGSANYAEAMLWTNYWPTTLIQIGEGGGVLMELSISFLRENPNKLCFIELSQIFFDGCLNLKKFIEKGNLKPSHISQKILPVSGFISTNVKFQPSNQPKTTKIGH